MSAALPVSRRLHAALFDLGDGRVRLRIDSSEPDCDGALVVVLLPGMIAEDARALEIDLQLSGSDPVRIEPKL